MPDEPPPPGSDPIVIRWKTQEYRMRLGSAIDVAVMVFQQFEHERTLQRILMSAACVDGAKPLFIHGYEVVGFLMSMANQLQTVAKQRQDAGMLGDSERQKLSAFWQATKQLSDAFLRGTLYPNPRFDERGKIVVVQEFDLRGNVIKETVPPL